jgi:hypothetical protein
VRLSVLALAALVCCARPAPADLDAGAPLPGGESDAEQRSVACPATAALGASCPLDATTPGRCFHGQCVDPQRYSALYRKYLAMPLLPARGGERGLAAGSVSVPETGPGPDAGPP